MVLRLNILAHFKDGQPDQYRADGDDSISRRTPKIGIITIPSSLFTLIDARASQTQAVSLERDRMAALFKEQEQFVRHIQGSAARLFGCDNIDHKPFAGPQVPPAQFIPHLMAQLGEVYYTGLLSAAEYHGAAHQKPQVFQVMVAKIRRPITCGNVRIEFVFRKNAAEKDVHAA